MQNAKFGQMTFKAAASSYTERYGTSLATLTRDYLSNTLSAYYFLRYFDAMQLLPAVDVAPLFLRKLKAPR